ncbi:MAG: type I 3-dehydroquinate dehydratase, partial [Planctomycetota bacterium]|nr:type I 3-dehydroquinate dehydratase [Planctomycetota bacterium]
MICVPIVAATHAEAEEQIRRSRDGGADLVELRLDYLQETPQVDRLVNAAGKQAIVTCRSRSEGGKFSGDITKQIALLQAGVDAGAAYVDAEAALAERLRRTSASRIIVSKHFLDRTPLNLASLFRELAALPGDIVKIATTATTPADNVRLLHSLCAAPKPAIGLCMAEMGEASRILCLRFGSLLTFASLAPGLESAAGQIPLSEMIDLYRVRRLTPQTALYAVVGDPISHSLSPRIHNC